MSNVEYEFISVNVLNSESFVLFNAAKTASSFNLNLIYMFSTFCASTSIEYSIIDFLYPFVSSVLISFRDKPNLTYLLYGKEHLRKSF